MDPSLQKKTLPGEAVKNSQNPVRASVLQPLMKEIQTPGLVGCAQLHLRLTRNLETPSASSVQPEAFLAPDPLGSVVMVRDGSGNTVYEAEYDPYGNVQSEAGTNPSSLGYVGTLGYIKDSATSMYVRARYLLNNLGRWLTKDPLWPSEPGFVYASAAPVKISDPLGLTPINIGATIGRLFLACGLSGALGYLGDWFSGGFSSPPPPNACSAISSCLIAIAGVLLDIVLTAALAIAGSCIAGAISGLFSALAGWMCNPPDPCERVDPLCRFLDALTQALSGCLGNLVGGAAGESFEKPIGAFISDLVSGIRGFFFGLSGSATNNCNQAT